MKPVLLIGLLAMVSVHAETVVEVSPEGRFRTLEAARNEIRRLKQEGRKAPFRVTVHPGDYFMDQGLELGKADADLVICASPSGTARFSGAKVIDPAWFEPVRDRGFLVRLADTRAGKHIRVADLKKHGITEYGGLSRHGWNIGPKDRIPPASLYVGGRRMTLARWPNPEADSPYMVYRHYLPEDRPMRGYELRVQEILDKIRLPGDVTLTRVVDPGDSARAGGTRGGTFEVAFDRMKYWNEPEQVFLDGVLGSTWEWTYNRIASVDPAGRRITLAHAELSGIAQGDSVRLPHFFFENILEEIDQPGEYYIDREQGLLYLYPPKEGGEILLSSLAAPMVSVANARNIRFQGLQFDTGRSLGVVIRNGENIVIDRCRIAGFTAGGVKADGKGIRIINSHIHGLGGFGISLDGGDARTLEPANNEVVNCRIHDFGWEQKSQLPGIMIDGVGQRVAHCEIHDGPHFGIRVKGKNDILIEHNEVYDLPKYHKLDGGSIYVYTGPRAESRGIVIRGNYFHDIPTIGVYPDNFSWGVEISHNLYRNVGVQTGRPAIWVNGGGECRTFNNIMVDCLQLYQQGVRPKEERWFTFWNRTIEEFGGGKVEHTPYSKYEDFRQWLAKKEKDEFFRPRSDIWNNVLYQPEPVPSADADASGLKRGVGRRHMIEPGVIDQSGQLRSKGNWVTSDDPGFVDYRAGDLNLREDAAVFSMVEGFEAIPFERMGRLDKPVL
jgi:hypothetical protein